MKEIIDADIPFHRIECPTEDAVKLSVSKDLKIKPLCWKLQEAFTPFLLFS